MFVIDSDFVGRINYDVIGDGIVFYYYFVNFLIGDIIIRNVFIIDWFNVNYVVSIYLIIVLFCYVLL